MEVNRTKNQFSNGYDYELIEGSKSLFIKKKGLEIDFILEDRNVSLNENVIMDFEITKENNEIFNLFDSLYKNILEDNIFTEEDDNFDFRYLCYYETSMYDHKKNCLIDEKNNINWLSDKYLDEIVNKLKISKLDNETYSLSFVSSENLLNINNRICIRFRCTGSRFDPHNIIFMKLYYKLQKIDPLYHQITMDEYQYIKRKSI